MLAKYQSIHWFDKDGNPEGGQASGTGFSIAWQRGPLGTGDSRQEPNGAFVETIIDAALHRLEFYQSSKFSCEENYVAIHNLKAAAAVLNRRTTRRTDDGTEGTHKGS